MIIMGSDRGQVIEGQGVRRPAAPRLLHVVLASVAALLSLAGGSRLEAEVKTDLAIQYYPVPYIEGYSAKQMIFETPPLVQESGRRTLGQTRWIIGTSNISFLQSPDGLCLLQSFEVTLSATVILPKLEDGAPGRAEREFAAYAEKIRRHEMEHYEIALRQARRLEAEYITLSRRNCDGFGEVLQNIYDRIVRECKAEQIDFDEREGLIEDDGEPLQ